MPMIELTTPSNALTRSKQHALMKTLTNTLLKWEGAPIDSAIAQAVSWGFVNEKPTGTFYVGGELIKQDHWRVEITVPQGALDADKKKGLVKDVQDEIAKITGDDDLGIRVWCIITDIPSGNWGADGKIFTITEIARAVHKSEKVVS